MKDSVETNYTPSFFAAVTAEGAEDGLREVQEPNIFLSTCGAAIPGNSS